MANFFKSLLSGNSEANAKSETTNSQKEFEIFKYDGIRAQRMGQAEYAEKCYLKALEINQDFETMGYLSQLYIMTQRLEEAEKTLRDMHTLASEHISTLLQLAQVCGMQSKYGEMAEAAQQAASLDTHNSTAYFLLGKACKQNNDIIMAIAHLTKAITLKDDFIEARLLRTEIMLALHQFKEAEEDLQTVFTLNPEDENALLLRGKLHAATGEMEKARQDFRQTITLNPFNEEGYLNLGNLLLQENEVEAAIELYNEAIDINPEFAAAYRERGRAKLMKGDKEGSIADIKKYMETDSEAEEKFNGEFNNSPAQTSKLPGN